MKVIILTKEFPKTGKDITISNGSSYYFYNACRVLDEGGIEVTVLCGGNHRGIQIEKCGRVTIHRIDFRRYFLGSLMLVGHVDRSNTIILTDGPAYTIFFGLFARVARLKHVAVFHDCRIRYYLSSLFAGHIDFGAIIAILLTYLSVVVNPRAIITVSEASKQELARAGFRSDRIFITYNWVSLDHAHKAQKQDQIVHLGLAPWKNVDLIIDAMPHIIMRVPKAKLYVIGRGDIEPYQKSVKDKKLTDKVHFCGLITEKEKRDILRKSKVLTLVSSLEGFGIPILEAWKNDAAPVLSRLPVFQEIARDGESCIMASLEPEKIAKCVVRLLLDDELRMKLCENGKRAIRSRFSSRNAFKKFHEVFASCMDLTSTKVD